ncbi:hypothetical protein [Telluribacter humicola]|uniref:hypothetical protein n=1 Tax=Telluribacter humicola TaxID=1720261 RepID=UPI001A96DCC8|nr:hypothetical protein [Telluribacter humicola]
MGHFSKDVKSISKPWNVTNEVNFQNYRYVTYTNEITGEYYMLTFWSPESIKIGRASFSGIPIHKYRSDLDHILKNFGFIYKPTLMKSRKDILIKKVDDGVFVVIELKEFEGGLINGVHVDNIQTGFMEFEIFEVLD